MTHRGTMALSDFYSSEELANEVLRYEMWRLSNGHSRDADTLLFEAPYRVGQLTTLGLGEPEEIKSALFKSARSREDFAKNENQALKDHISNAFKQGISEPHLDWYHMPRSAWSK